MVQDELSGFNPLVGPYQGSWHKMELHIAEEARIAVYFLHVSVRSAMGSGGAAALGTRLFFETWRGAVAAYPTAGLENQHPRRSGTRTHGEGPTDIPELVLPSTPSG